MIRKIFCALVLSCPVVAQAQPFDPPARGVVVQSLTIQGTVTSTTGAVGVYGPVTVTIDAVNINSSTVDKPAAPAGTMRTLTVSATSTSGASMSAPLPTAPGITFTPVVGQPLGTFKWTFVY